MFLLSSEATSDQPLVVSASGIDDRNDTLVQEVYRPHGRKDYQLILLLAGQGTVKYNGMDYLARKGDVILFLPGQPQHYLYSPRHTAYWVHFTGTEAASLLPSLEAPPVLSCRSVFAQLRTWMQALLAEQHAHLPQKESCAQAYLRLIFAALCRAQTHSAPMPSAQFSQLLPALSVLENYCFRHDTIAELARACSLSPYHFIRLFRACTGLTPVAYRTKIAMEKAERLLAETEMPVKAISSALGYSDPLYFSRVFTAYTGSSPTAYRMNLAQAQRQK